MAEGTTVGPQPGSRDWLRVLGLFGVVLMTSMFVSPGVVIGVPLALLLAAGGFGSLLSAAVAGLVIVIVAGGQGEVTDGLWYAERGWAVLLGGWFLALGLLLPSWRLTSRALAAGGCAAVVAAAVFVVRPGSWALLDAEVYQIALPASERAAAFLTEMGGSGEVGEAAQNLTTVLVSVFPALLGIESMAALGVAWWARSRLVGETSGLAPLSSFRFNDHLVWVMVVGLLLLVFTQPGGALGRVGSNALLFMGALYALRGAAVFAFVSGGISLLTSLVLIALLIFLPVVLLGTAALIGIGDTWLDLRARTAEEAA